MCRLDGRLASLFVGLTTRFYLVIRFYARATIELTSTTISVVVAVTIVAFVLIPHWSATIYVLPLMVVLNVDLLGMIQFAGLHINVRIAELCFGY